MTSFAPASSRLSVDGVVVLCCFLFTSDEEIHAKRKGVGESYQDYKGHVDLEGKGKKKFKVMF